MRKIRKEADVSGKMVTKVVEAMRRIMFWELSNGLEGQKLGGPGKIVAMDETYMTKKKRASGGFQGRSTQGHKTCIIGMVELDMETRQETGKYRLIPIPSPSAALIKEQVLANVHPGSSAW